MRFVDEPTQVKIRLNSADEVIPQAFTWLGEELAVAGIGRRWEEEETDGVVWHFLVMTAGGDRFELTHRATTGAWRVVRVWQRRRLV